MPASGFRRKCAAIALFALIVLMLFLAAAISAPTAAQVNPHYLYTPSSTSVIAGDPAGDSFDLTVGLSFIPSEGWWVDTQVFVIAPEEPFTFFFNPSSFTLTQATQSQVVHVTVTAPEGTADGSRMIKAKMVVGSGAPSVGEGDGCTVSITVSEAPTPTPPPPGCFIATAAYGTSTAAELDTLRAFRDEVLLQYGLGSRLVSLYYEVSPPLADFISEHGPIRTLVRELLVDPVVWVVEATEPLWRD